MEWMDLGLLNAAMSGNVDQLRPINLTLLSGTTPQQNTALHVSVMYGQKEFAEEICNMDSSMLLKVNSRQETPLHFAAALGYDFIVSFFIQFIKSSTASQHAGDVEEAGGDARLHQLLRATNETGDTALHEAVRNGWAAAAMELLREDPETLQHVNNDGESVLYLAAVRPLRGVVSELAKKDYVDYCNCAGPGGRTALHAAVLADDTETAQMLLQAWPELARERDETESTPLHCAAESSVAVTQKLLDADHSMAYVLNRDGCSPLHVSAKMSKVEAFQAIVLRCPDAVGVLDRRGRNVLHVAINAQALGMVRHILGDRRLAALMNQRDNDGNTPLHEAAGHGDGDSIIQLMLQHETLNRKAVNKKGETAGDILFKAATPRFTMKSILGAAILMHPLSGRAPRDEEMKKIQDESGRSVKEYVEKLLIVATLVATVTFAAPFAMPGGYNSNDSSYAGMAVLAKKAALQVFLLCDTVAMLCSVLAVVFGILMVRQGTSVETIVGLEVGYSLMDMSFTFMSLAFATGVYVVTSSSCLWLAILVCLMCCSIPIFNVVRFIRWGCRMVALFYYAWCYYG